MGDGWEWDLWLDEALKKLETAKHLRSLRPLLTVPSEGSLPSYAYPSIAIATLDDDDVSPPTPHLRLSGHRGTETFIKYEEEFETFDGLGPWDRSSVVVKISEPTFQLWINNLCSTGQETCDFDILLDNVMESRAQPFRNLLLFSGNDYLGLSAHPTVRHAAAKAAQEHGMGPRGSALVCGYTYYHRLLESALADLKKKEGHVWNLSVYCICYSCVAWKHTPPTHSPEVRSGWERLRSASGSAASSTPALEVCSRWE